MLTVIILIPIIHTVGSRYYINVLFVLLGCIRAGRAGGKDVRLVKSDVGVTFGGGIAYFVTVPMDN